MLLAIIFSMTISGSQNPPDSGICGLLNAILRDSVSTRIFKLNKHPELLSIRFVDKSGLLDSNCTPNTAFGKSVEVVSKPPSGFTLRRYDITIPNIEREGKRYKVLYFQPSTGATGYIKLRREKKGFKVTKVFYSLY